MGQYLDQPIKEKTFIEGTNGKISYVASSMQGYFFQNRWRVSMEDAEIAKLDLLPGIHIFGVFDGHGGIINKSIQYYIYNQGNEVAKFVEKHFIEELLKNTNFKNKKYKEALEENFYLMDELMIKDEGQKELLLIANQTAQSDKSNSDNKLDANYECLAGCTATVALIADGVIYVANAGDSRTMISSKGNCVPLSQDHKPDNLQEKERISAAGGYVIEGRSIRQNLLLMKSNINQEILNIKNSKIWQRINNQLQLYQKYKVKYYLQMMILSFQDVLFLQQDGIFERQDNQENVTYIHQQLMKNSSLKNIADSLLDLLLAPNTQVLQGLDNMSLIIVNLKKG